MMRASMFIRLVPYPYLLLFLLSGCHYSLPDLRAMPPTKTLDAKADYAALATCTKQRYDGAHLDKLQLWQDPGVAIARLGYWERRAFLWVDIDRAWFEIRFIGTGSAQTRIDIRNSPSEKLPLDPMLTAVNGCIASLTSASPS